MNRAQNQELKQTNETGAFKFLSKVNAAASASAAAHTGIFIVIFLALKICLSDVYMRA